MSHRWAYLGFLLSWASVVTTAAGQSPRSVAIAAWAGVDGRVAAIQRPQIPADTVLVLAYGASPDSTVDSRLAVQTAIDSLSARGGGVVVVPGHLSLLLNGPLHLRPRINLHLEAGSRLRFSDRAEDYLPLVKVRWEGTVAYNYSPLIYANGAHDVAITGLGTIDGQGADWSRRWRGMQKSDKSALRAMGADGTPEAERRFGPGHYLRPGLVQLYDCRRILLDGPTFRDSPFWTIHLPFSRHVTCRNLTVLGNTLNDDGIDPDSSQDVLIEDCYIRTHDDAISIKAGRDADAWGRPGSRNVIVRNCTLDSGVNSFAIGSELSGGVEDVFVDEVRLLRGKHGLTVKTNSDRGGFVRRVFMRNVTADTLDRHLLYFTTVYKGYRGGNAPTEIDQIYLMDVHADRVNDAPLSLGGAAANPIAGVYLDGVTVGEAGGEDVIAHTELTRVAVREGELDAAIRTGADYAADVLLTAEGNSRCDYNWRDGRWHEYEAAWHTGQVILGLLKAYERTEEPRYLEAARRGGDWWLTQVIGDEWPELVGYLRAVHAGPVGEIINFTTIADGTPGLFELSRVTGDSRYADAAVRAGDWALEHLYLEDEGLIIDLVDAQTGKILTETSPFFEGELSIDQIARPNNEGFLYYDAYRHTRDERYREVFIRLCNSLVDKQSDNGFWMDYHPNNPDDGKIHPRSNTWYAESLLRGYELTGDERYREAALRTARALVKLQTKRGVIYYRNYADGRSRRSSLCGSAVSFAGLIWLELYQMGHEEFERPLRRARNWVLTNRFPTDHPDPNLRGAFLETRRYERPDGVVVNVRDIATAFGLRFLAALERADVAALKNPKQ